MGSGVLEGGGEAENPSPFPLDSPWKTHLALSSRHTYIFPYQLIIHFIIIFQILSIRPFYNFFSQGFIKNPYQS